MPTLPRLPKRRGMREPMKDELLNELRAEIAEIDRQIFDLALTRNEVAERIGDRKRELGHPQRDYVQEKLVLDRARSLAEKRGLDPNVYEPIVLTLIRASTTVEERGSMNANARGNGHCVLVLGGRGKMGGWMLSFLHSQGFSLVSVDPSGEVPGIESHGDWTELDLDRFDAIVVATPLNLTNETLLALAARKPRGVVFDVGSLKSPLRGGIQALNAAGVAVTSIHPMFGPDVELLSGQHVIFIDCGNPEALAYAHALFAPTTAVQVDMTLDEHDSLIAYVLGLSHALNIAFFTALAQSGESAPRLARMSSTTFDAQLRVADKVAHENPWLYYDIQALNDFGMGSLDALHDAVTRIRAAVKERNTDAFVQIMQEGRDYLDGRAPSDDVLKNR